MTSPISLTDAIRQSILYQLGTIHTALPAAIIDYDYTVQKASVQPLLNKVWTNALPEPMPVLENVPVIFLFASIGTTSACPELSTMTAVVVAPVRPAMDSAPPAGRYAAQSLLNWVANEDTDPCVYWEK